MGAAEMQMSRPALSGIVWGIVLNAIIPVVLYKVSRRYLSPSEFTALVIASTFPFGKSIFDLVRIGQVDPISIVVLLGLATDGAALLFGGSPRLLLVRESLFTGVFGLSCFVSLLLPRPMNVLFRAAFHGKSRSAAAGPFQCGLAIAGGTFFPSADNQCLGMCLCGRADSSDHFDLPCARVDSPGCVAHPDRHPDHRHHDLGVQLWAPSPAACLSPAQSSPRPQKF